jgi:hypothetical protein
MVMLNEGAEKQRDRILRKKMLFILSLCTSSPRGGMGGRQLLMNVAEDVADGLGFESDDHAMRLIRDLVNKRLVTEEILERLRGRIFGPEHLFLRITDAGSRLIRRVAPIDPDIDDERVSE